jgi:hypothetical protein
MKSLSARLLESLRHEDGELIALHGDARLMRHLNGRYELCGGTPADRQHVKEWCSLFLHEAAFACNASQVSALTLARQRGSAMPAP